MGYARSLPVLLLAPLLWMHHCPAAQVQARVRSASANYTMGNRLEEEKPTAEVQRVMQESTLAQVLGEWLRDVETVELTGLQCAAGHRMRHADMSDALLAKVRRCVGKRGAQEVAQCVEVDTRSLVSDVRLIITKLKDCVDQS